MHFFKKFLILKKRIIGMIKFYPCRIKNRYHKRLYFHISKLFSTLTYYQQIVFWQSSFMIDTVLFMSLLLCSRAQFHLVCLSVYIELVHICGVSRFSESTIYRDITYIAEIGKIIHRRKCMSEQVRIHGQF